MNHDSASATLRESHLSSFVIHPVNYRNNLSVQVIITDTESPRFLIIIQNGGGVVGGLAVEVKPSHIEKVNVNSLQQKPSSGAI